MFLHFKSFIILLMQGREKKVQINVAVTDQPY